MKISDLYPSRYLRGSDLSGPVIVQVQRVGMEKIYRPQEKGEVDVPILYVVGGSKGVILGKALAESVVQAIGENDTDAWPGRKFVLYPQAMRVGGKDVVALRARAVAQEQPQPAGQGEGNEQT